MSKQEKAKSKVLAPTLSKGAGPARRRRNMFQRRCLGKALKRQFAGLPSSIMRALLQFEQSNKARTTA